MHDDGGFGDKLNFGPSVEIPCSYCCCTNLLCRKVVLSEWRVHGEGTGVINKYIKSRLSQPSREMFLEYHPSVPFTQVHNYT